MSEHILVTGAAGFIGSGIVRRLNEQGRQVFGVDALLGGLYPAQEKRERFAELSSLSGVEMLALDLRDGDLSLIPGTITHVINEAAMPGLSLSWDDFELYSSCNLSALSRLLEVAKSWPVEKFVQVSTSSVYGAHAVGDESQALQPVSPYGVTKLAAEHLALAYWRDSGIPSTVLRYFSVYGPGQRPDMAYRKFITQALAGDPITLYGTGEQSRTNTYISDCVEATISALALAMPGEIYNISGSEQRTINEALAIIESLTNHPLTIVRESAARGDQLETRGDSAKAREQLGLKDSVNLESGLENQWKWLLERR
jgi:nucleoside-diphosphate-sugar epimerase